MLIIPALLPAAMPLLCDPAMTRTRTRANDFGFGDAHVHLQDPAFSDDLDEVIARAQRAGVHRFVVNGTCEEDWGTVTRLCLSESLRGRAHAFVGMHPWRLAGASAGWRQGLEALASAPLTASGSPPMTASESPSDPHKSQLVAGLGETGLDMLFCPDTLDDQAEALTFHLSLSRRLSLPVCVHCLKAWNELFEVLGPLAPFGEFRGGVKGAAKDGGVPNGNLSRPCLMVHGFGGSPETAARLVSMGCHISLGGSILARGQARAAAILRAIPPELLLIESDAPFMIPPPEALSFTPVIEPLSSRLRNEPTAAVDSARAFAALLKRPPEDLMASVGTNLGRFLGLRDKPAKIERTQ